MFAAPSIPPIGTWLAASLVVLGLFASPARAQDLSVAEAALARGAYTQAQLLAHDAIRAGTRTGEELIAPYRVLAWASGYLDAEEIATRAFTALLALDPSYRLPAAAPPEVRSPYMNARGFWSAHAVHLGARASASDDAASIVVTVNDPARLGARVRLRTRLAGSDHFAETVLPSEDTLLVRVPGLDAASSADYSLTILDEHGNRLWQLGSDATPAVLAVRALSPAPTASSMERGLKSTHGDIGAPTRSSRPYYIAASTLLVVSAGALAGGAVAQARREQLAGKWNRGDCNGTGTTRGMICAAEDRGMQNMTRLAFGLYGGGAAALLSGLVVLLLAPTRPESSRPRSDATAWRCSGTGPLSIGCSRGF